MNSFAAVPVLIEEIRAGRMVVIVDDEDQKMRAISLWLPSWLHRRTLISW